MCWFNAVDRGPAYRHRANIRFIYFTQLVDDIVQSYTCSPKQILTAVTAHLKSKQLLLFTLQGSADDISVKLFQWCTTSWERGTTFKQHWIQ